MDEVVKNTHAFVDILCTARGEAVQGWDEETFHRAFKWAQYFEQVHSKLKSKPGLANKLDRYIKSFNKTTTVYLGHLHLSFTQLSNSKHILRNCLLQNPYLSSSQFGHVLKLYGITVGSENEATSVEMLEKDVVDFMKQKGTLKLLSQMRDKVTAELLQLHGVQCDHKTKKPEIFNSDNFMVCPKTTALDICTTQSIARDATGELLFKYVQHVLEFSEARNHHLINEKLDVISTQEYGIDTIASCLLYLPDDCQSFSKTEMTQRFILKWLLDSLESSSNHSIWYLPKTYLSKISYKYEDILKLYLNHLISWGNKMMPFLTYQLPQQERTSLICNQVYVWRCPDDFSSNVNYGMFDDLVQHFMYLMSGPAHVQELCCKIIKSNIGSYDNKMSKVKEITKLGVNVWIDVCKEISIDI